MNLDDFKNKQFTKVLRGYDTQEVDDYIDELLKLCQIQENKIRGMEKKLSTYEEQEQILKATLVTAEQTAAAIKNNAALTAKNIQANAEKKAIDLIKNTENETKIYRNQVNKCFFTYERELRLVIDRFYVLARNHMEVLEKELADEIRSAVSSLDTEFNMISKLKLVPITSGKNENKTSSITDKYRERETAALLGRVLKQDIYNSEGNLIAKKDTVITPDLINSVIGKGLYGELIVAAEI